MKQIGIAAALTVWAVLCAIGVAFALWQGYRGPAFVATAATFAFLLLVMLAFAGRGVADRLAKRFGPAGGFLLGAILFIAYVFYLVGTGSFAITRAAIVAVLIFLPMGIAVTAARAAGGAWQDFLILAAVWVFVKFGPSHYLWPYPGARLSYVFTILLCVDTAIATFLLIRRIQGVGYSIGWGKRWTFYILVSFAVLAFLAVPTAIAMHFVVFEPHWNQWPSFAGLSLAILLFTAWPEEFLFRGLLQNMLSRAAKNEFAGWWTASMLFGFSHITNMGFPNWRYVTLAAVAGLFYGWTWRRCNSIFASALVHAAVDIIWHFLFRTL